MKHIMDWWEDIFKQIQLQSNIQGYGGRHYTRIVKSFLANATDVND